MSASFDPSGPAQFDGLFGLPSTEDDARVVVIPVPWEPTTSFRKGTAKGPAAVLEASHQVDLFDLAFDRPYEAGIAMLDVDPDIERWNKRATKIAQPIIDAGGGPGFARDLAKVNALSDKLNARVEKIADALLDKGKLVGLLGGDHSSPFGLISALARRHPGMGILHVDAHADLRDAYEGFTHSHASIFYNVHELVPDVARIVQVGVRDFSEDEFLFSRHSKRITTYFDADLARRGFAGEPFTRVTDEIIGKLPREVYVSIDIDGLDPSFCPDTGTPVPGGLSFRELNHLLVTLATSGRTVVGFDLNEVAGSEWDAIVGARVLYKLIGAMLVSQAVSAASISRNPPAL